MDRDYATITDLISAAQTDLEELKEAQFFGGDALIVNEWTEKLSNDSSVNYRLTLTPDDPKLGVLPSTPQLMWTNPNASGQSAQNYYCNPVYRTDGIFEWVLVGGHVDNFDTYLKLQYLGKGTVELRRV